MRMADLTLVDPPCGQTSQAICSRSSKRYSTIRLSQHTNTKTDISSLPFELHQEILDWLDHWVHILTASQVCQSWRHHLRDRKDLKSLYQEVHLLEPVDKRFGHFTRHQQFIFGSPSQIPSGFGKVKSVFDHKRHVLFQDCTVQYRRNEKGKGELKIHPSKETGYYDRHSLSYYPDGRYIPEFYRCYYLSLLSSPLLIDDRPLISKTRVLIDMKKICVRVNITTMEYDGAYKSLGKILNTILDRYSDCFKLMCRRCYKKFAKKRKVADWLDNVERGEDADGECEEDATRNEAYGAALAHLEQAPGEVTVGDGQGSGWTVEAYEDFELNTKNFGVIIKEEESKRTAGTMVLRVSPAESW